MGIVKPKPKQPRGRQHMLRGASWLSYAARLRGKALIQAHNPAVSQALEIAADCAEEEGKASRKLR